MHENYSDQNIFGALSEHTISDEPVVDVSITV